MPYASNQSWRLEKTALTKESARHASVSLKFNKALDSDTLDRYIFQLLIHTLLPIIVQCYTLFAF